MGRLLSAQAQLDLARAIAPAHDLGKFRALGELSCVDASGRGGKPAVAIEQFVSESDHP
jgi:hypothetical protein